MAGKTIGRAKSGKMMVGKARKEHAEMNRGRTTAPKRKNSVIITPSKIK